jgi:hypothetical protein
MGCLEQKRSADYCQVQGRHHFVFPARTTATPEQDARQRIRTERFSHGSEPGPIHFLAVFSGNWARDMDSVVSADEKVLLIGPSFHPNGAIDCLPMNHQ